MSMITPNSDKEVKTIVLVGKTGSGKSSLANLLLGKQKFAVGEGSFSETKELDSDEFEVDGQRYRIIDTIGLGDDELPQSTVLSRIAKVSHIVAQGKLHQLVIVYTEKVTKETLECMRIITSVIFNSDILKHTVIVRAKSDFFQTESKCQQERDNLAKKTKEEYKFIFQNANKILFIENPPIDAQMSPQEVATRKSLQNKSREIILAYLASCKGCYQIPDFGEMEKRISDYVDKDKKLEEEYQKKIAELTEKLNNNQISPVQFEKFFEEMKASREMQIQQNNEMLARMVEMIKNIPPPQVHVDGGCTIS